MRLAFRMAYYGTGFWGSQSQPALRTVEGELREACLRLGLFSDPKEAHIAFAGRTDRGVHARAQVCAFTTHLPHRAKEALNRVLPTDCWVTGVAEVDDGFSPRYAAKTRTYRYYFPKEGLSLSSMASAASLFCGTHDFSRFFKPAGKEPLITILSSSVTREDGMIVFEVQARNFLWHMVRCMAASLEAVGRQDWDPEEIGALLADPAGGDRLCPAPPEGLVLWDVDCGLTFESIREEEVRQSAKNTLRSRYSMLKKVSEIL